MNASRRPLVRLTLRVSRRALPALLLIPALVGCTAGATSSPATHINVVAGENFYGDLAARVGGDLVSVTSILNDPTVDPHTYESSPANAQAVADARLVIENGVGYDAFLDHLVGASPRADRTVIKVQDLLGVADDVNAHIWYDPQTMPKVARAVADALKQLQPGSSTAVEANLKTYLDSFAPLTAKIAALKAKYPGLKVAYTEPVPGYLVIALGWQSLTPEGFAKSIEEGTDPAPADVAAERDLLTGHQVKVLLYNSQATSPVTESIQALAGQSGVPVVGVSETIPVAGQSFVDWQLAQLNAIDTALGAGK